MLLCKHTESIFGMNLLYYWIMHFQAKKACNIGKCSLFHILNKEKYDSISFHFAFYSNGFRIEQKIIKYEFFPQWFFSNSMSANKICFILLKFSNGFQFVHPLATELQTVIQFYIKIYHFYILDFCFLFFGLCGSYRRGNTPKFQKPLKNRNFYLIITKLGKYRYSETTYSIKFWAMWIP